MHSKETSILVTVAPDGTPEMVIGLETHPPLSGMVTFVVRRTSVDAALAVTKLPRKIIVSASAVCILEVFIFVER